MNKKYTVCAGWIPGDPVIGNIYIDNPRGEEIISFQYDEAWLLNNNVFLDPSLEQTTARQYSQKKYLFGFLEDVSPDRWGKKLIERAARRGGITRQLLPSDYLIGVSDFGRTGGIRIKDSDGKFIGTEFPSPIPPITELRKLEDAIRAFEQNRAETDIDIKDLLAAGSSLGGARPKANVIDTDGSLWIAKFPSKYDDYDVGAWEMVAHELAKLCQISVPPAKTKNISGKGTTFLVKRFDRDETGARIHYCSAMTALGEHDNSSEDVGYSDILFRLSSISGDFTADARMLFERMVFNICIGNTDDHLRNHGFLLRDEAWRLSEAFDINPSVDKKEMSLVIADGSRERSLELALKDCELFEYSKKEALAVMERMATAICCNLHRIAKQYGLSNSDIDYMLPAFSECFRFYQSINK